MSEVTKRSSNKSNTGAKRQAGAVRNSQGRPRSAEDSQKVEKRSKENSRSATEAAIKEKDFSGDTTLRDEIIIIIALLFSALLMLSYFDLCGIVGRWLNTIVFGLMGDFGYAFPFVLFLLVAFLVSNRGNRLTIRKVIYGVCMVFFISALVQIIFGGYSNDIKLLEYFTNSLPDFTGGVKTHGGLMGGFICRILCPYVGNVAAICIMLVCSLIFIMLITGKAIFTYINRRTREKKQQRRQNIYDEEFSTDDIHRRQKRHKMTMEEKLLNAKAKAPDEESFVESLKKRGASAHGRDVKQETTADTGRTADEGAYEIREIEPDKSNSSDYADMELKRKFNGKTAIEIPVLRKPIRTIYDNYANIFVTDEEENHQDKADAATASETFRDNIINITGLHRDNETDGQCHDHLPETGEGLFTHDICEAVADISVDSGEDTADTSEPVADNVASEDITEIIDDTSPEQNKITDIFKDGSAKREKPSSGAACFTDMSIQPAQPARPVKKYIFPPIGLLTRPGSSSGSVSRKELNDTADKLKKTFESFGVGVSIENVSCGPTVTRYELHPEQGVKVSRITSLADDIKLSLAAADIRIEAPIPGKSAVGIEVPNRENSPVLLRELLESEAYKKHKSEIAFAVGKDISGQTIVADIAKMPHLLIAGATGSGKSVCINTLIISILYKAKPSDVKLIMIDPKVVELNVYNGIPHLLIPVVTDPKKASGALNWAVVEMTDRYKRFADAGVRDLKGYNEKILAEEAEGNIDEEHSAKLPQIVIIVDELADLMMVASGDVEDAICRLAQLARAAGIHLVIATQRPTVNVITGQIKANVPSRIAFSVSSALDSRTIIDGAGAEKLLGKGDMLFFPSGYSKPVRLQGAFVSDNEVIEVVKFLKEQCKVTHYSEEVDNHIANSIENDAGTQVSASSNDRDEYFVEAGRFIIEKEKASIGMLQRVYKIGFNRAARIMDQLSEAGVVGPEEGTKPRKIIMTLAEFDEFCKE